jgi:hypothetical protein
MSYFESATAKIELPENCKLSESGFSGFKDFQDFS